MNDQEEKIEQLSPLHEVDVDSLAADGRIQQLHQEGNFLVGVTHHGVRFRQRIKPGQMLTKSGDRYRIVPLSINEG